MNGYSFKCFMAFLMACHLGVLLGQHAIIDPGSISAYLENERKEDNFIFCKEDIQSLKFENEQSGNCVNFDGSVRYCWKIVYNNAFIDAEGPTRDDSTYFPVLGDFKAGSGKYEIRRYAYCDSLGNCEDNDKFSSVSCIVAQQLTESDFRVTAKGYACDSSGAQIEVLANQIYQSLKLRLFKGNALIKEDTMPESGFLIFSNIAEFGEYTIKVVENDLYCESIIAKNLRIDKLSPPILVTDSPDFCSGDTVRLEMKNIQKDVLYKFYNEALLLNSLFSGNNQNVHFNATQSGKYFVIATDSVSGCEVRSTDTLILRALMTDVGATFVSDTLYSCGMDTVRIGLKNAKKSHQYVLLRNKVPVDTISFPDTLFKPFVSDNQNDRLVYSVKVSLLDAVNCERVLPDSLILFTASLPNKFELSGGGEFCSGEPGVQITLNGSDKNVNYILKNGDITIRTLMGDGNEITFANVNSSGQYIVEAENMVGKGCKVVLNDTIFVQKNPLPGIREAYYSDAAGNSISYACQNSKSDALLVNIALGSSPFTCFINGNPYSKIDSILKLPLDTRSAGLVMNVIDSLVDSKGCRFYPAISKDIVINPAPLAEIIKVQINKIDTIFTLEAESSEEDEKLTFNWLFSNQIKIGEDSTKEGKSKILTNVSLINQSNQYATLTVKDSLGCLTKDYVFFPLIDSCLLSYNENICTDSSQIATSISLNSVTFNILDDYCPGCVWNNNVESGTSSLPVSAINISDNRTIKVPVQYTSRDSACIDKIGLVAVTIRPTGRIKNKELFDPDPIFRKTICKDLPDAAVRNFLIQDVMPGLGLTLYYTNNGNHAFTEVSQGKFNIVLENSKTGINYIEFDSIKNSTGGNCAKLLTLPRYEYNVIECRTPEPLVSLAFPSQSSACLNQSGIVLKYTDRNKIPDGFTVRKDSIVWCILVNNSEIKNVLEIKSDTLAFLNLESGKFRAGETVTIKVKSYKYFSNSSTFFIGEATTQIKIGTSSAPERSVIRKYPGNLYYFDYKDTTLCMRWAYADLTQTPSPDWENGIEITGSTLIKKSNSGYAVFANDAFTVKLEKTIGAVRSPEAYLWVDTYKKDNGVCQFKPSNCFARTYYNSSLPPTGSPRNSDELVAFDIKPNPASDRINVSMQNDYLGFLDVWFTDLHGKVIKSYPAKQKLDILGEWEFDVSDFMKGVYFINIRTDAGQLIPKRLMVTH